MFLVITAVCVLLVVIYAFQSGIKFALLLSAIFGVLLVFVLAVLLCSADFSPKEVKSGKQYVSALGNAQGVSGSMRAGFFVSTGTINDTQVIQYVRAHKDGYSELKKVNANKARIYMDEEKRPYLVKFYEVPDPADWLGIDWVYDTIEPDKRYVRTDFHIPKGSVANDYKIDVNK